jgi:hypothetical protein
VIRYGALQCWGRNANGQVMLFALYFEFMMRLHNVELCFTLCFFSQLGDGSAITPRLTPVGVVGLNSSVSSISLGPVRYAFDLVVVPKLCFNAITGLDAACVGLR